MYYFLDWFNGVFGNGCACCFCFIEGLFALITEALAFGMAGRAVQFFSHEGILTDLMLDWIVLKSFLLSDITLLTFDNVSVSLFLLYINMLIFIEY